MLGYLSEYFIIPILQIRKLKLGKMKYPFQSHQAYNWWRWAGTSPYTPHSRGAVRSLRGRGEGSIREAPHLTATWRQWETTQ